MENIKKQLKQRIKWMYNHIRHKNISMGYVFMLHRVGNIDQSKLMANENMKVSPEYLDDFLKFMKSKYDIVRTEEVPSLLNKERNRPFVCFTMDDGYKDNYTTALPIFKKHNVPFTIFLASDFMKGTANLWWYALEDLILNHEEIELSDGSKYTTRTMEEKQDSFMEIRKLILGLNPLVLEDSLYSLFSSYSINWRSRCKELCMTWAEVEELRKEPLVTIGGHTQKHACLKSLPSIDDVRNEVRMGWQMINEYTGLTPEVFAYPFGTKNEADVREFVVLQDMKVFYKLAFRATGGPITKEDSNLYSLPRIILTNNFRWDEMRKYDKIII